MAATAKKKPASKNAKQAKTSRKTTAKKVVATKKKAISSSISKGVSFDRIQKFNIFAAISNAVFAVLSLIFISKDTVVANLPYAAKDEFASTTTTVFGAAYKTLCEVEIRYILALIFGLSAIFSLLLATKLQNRYKSQLNNSVSVIRWIFSGISLGLVLMLVSKLTHIDNIVMLKTIGALVLVSSILWIMSEQQIKDGKSKIALYYLSLFTLLLAVMPLLVSLIASGIYGMEWLGWHIYLLAVAIIVGLAAISYNQYKIAKNGISVKGYLDLESKNLSIEYLVKFSVFIILLTALFK